MPSEWRALVQDARSVIWKCQQEVRDQLERRWYEGQEEVPLTEEEETAFAVLCLIYDSFQKQ